MKIERIGFQNPYVNKTVENKRINYINKSVNDSVSFGNSKDISIVGKRFLDSIKVIFSDIDGTISPYSDLMSEKTLKAINFIHNKKVPFVMTTARCYTDSLPIIEQLGHKPEYTIALQGGGVYNKEGQPILINTIFDNSGKKLVKWFRETQKEIKNSHLIMYFNDTAYAESGVKFPWKVRCQVNQIDSFDKFFNNNNRLQKAIVYNVDELHGGYNSQAMLDLFKKSGINELEMKTSGRGFYEIQNRWVSKDKALDFLLRRLNIEPKHAMAIGDSSNDIEMLDFLRKRNGLSIAMGNADDAVKEHTNAVTSSIDEDGFSYAIEHLFSKK